MRPEELVEQKLCDPFLLEEHLKGRGHDRVHAERSTHTVVPPLLDAVSRSCRGADQDARLES